MTEEDEAWAELESKLGKKQIQEAILSLNTEMERYRNEVIEEVANRIEQEFTVPFGTDTISSFATYIRGMKSELDS